MESLGEHLSDEQLKEIIKEIDKNGNNKINLLEFMDAVRQPE